MKINFLPLLALLFLTTSAFSQNKLIDKVVAVIGDKVVLHSQIEEQIQYMESQGAGVPENARCLIADQLIAQHVFLVQANFDSLVVSEEEIEGQLTARIDQILGYMGNDVNQLEAYYEKSIPEIKEDFRQDIEEQMLVEKMKGEIVNDVGVTPAEVKRFFNNIPKDSLPFFNAEVEVSEIVIKPKVNKEELQKAYKKLEKIRVQIQEDGKDFSELASIYSDDPGSAAQGGDLGWVKRGELVPEFEAAAFRLKPMEFSPLVKTSYGYHLIQLIERRGNTVNARHILVKPEITLADKDLAKAKLDTVRNLILTDSVAFGRAVKKYSEDDQSKNNAGRLINQRTGVSTFEVGELTPEVYFAIDPMKEGEISEPIEYLNFAGETAYRIIKLDSKTDPHQANLKEDYAKIQTATLEQKKLMHMESWLVEKVQKVYISITEDYQQCPDINRWVNQSGNSLR